VSLFTKRAPVTAGAANVRLTPPRYGPGWGVGISRLAPVDFAPPYEVYSRESAMSIPTIKRARDLIVSAVGGLPLTQWTIDYSAPEPVEQRVPQVGWMVRPDPGHTRQWLVGWTVDDLLFNSRAYWHVTGRYATTFPSAFEWMPATEVSVDAHSGRVTWNGASVDPFDVIEFCSPLDGLLWCGYRAIQTALNLDMAAERFSTNEIPAGWLEQTPDSEPLDAAELAEIASTFQAARQARTVAALNPFLRWKESGMDPSRLQLVEARQYQSLELSRLANIPPYFVGSAVAGSSLTYQNSVQAKTDLLDFGCMAFLQCIEQTLSGDNVLPRNSFVRFDLNAWLRNPLITGPGESAPNDAEIAINPEPDVNDGRPRQADGNNATTGVPAA